MFKRPRVNDEIGKALDFKSESSIPVHINLPASDKKEEKKRGEDHERKFQESWLEKFHWLESEKTTNLLCSANYVRNMEKQCLCAGFNKIQN